MPQKVTAVGFMRRLAGLSVFQHFHYVIVSGFGLFNRESSGPRDGFVERVKQAVFVDYHLRGHGITRQRRAFKPEHRLHGFADAVEA